VLLAAVSQHWHAIHHCPGHLRDDPEIMLAACAQVGSALKFASKRLLWDYDFILEVPRPSMAPREAPTARGRGWLLVLR
jgi:hypothetical protein